MLLDLSRCEVIQFSAVDSFYRVKLLVTPGQPKKKKGEEVVKAWECSGCGAVNDGGSVCEYCGNGQSNKSSDQPKKNSNNQPKRSDSDQPKK